MRQAETSSAETIVDGKAGSKRIAAGNADDVRAGDSKPGDQSGNDEPPIAEKSDAGKSDAGKQDPDTGEDGAGASGAQTETTETADEAESNLENVDERHTPKDETEKNETGNVGLEVTVNEVMVWDVQKEKPAVDDIADGVVEDAAPDLVPDLATDPNVDAAADVVDEATTDASLARDRAGEGMGDEETAHSVPVVSPTGTEDKAVTSEANAAGNATGDVTAKATEAATSEEQTPAISIEDATPENADSEPVAVGADEADESESSPAEPIADGPVADETAQADPSESATPEGDSLESDLSEADTAEKLPAERVALAMNAVKIRGRPGGVAIEIGVGEWDELLGRLRDRLKIAEGFFRGGRVVLDVGDRQLGADHLQAAFAVLSDFEMQIAVVRTQQASTLEAAVALGITATASDADDALRSVGDAHAEVQSEQFQAYYVHHGNLRSGQVLQREENIIVIGDVNPGAQVVSSGDILIWGRLRGSAHAGVDGDEQAMVTALDFAPTQLRIAGLMSIPPEEKRTTPTPLLFWRKEPEQSGAEFAYAAEGRIFVEPWNASKPGSLTARRRLVL